MAQYTLSKETSLFQKDKISDDVADAGTKATDYILFDASNGIKLHNSGDTTNYLQIKSAGLYIYKGGKEFAYFDGTHSAVGENGKARTVVESDGLHVYDYNNNTQKEGAFFGVTSGTGGTARIGYADSWHSTMKNDGLHIWKGVETTSSNELAFFGATARIGVYNKQRIALTSNGIDVYNSSNVKMGSFGSSVVMGNPSGDNIKVSSSGLEFIYNGTSYGGIYRNSSDDLVIGSSISAVRIESDDHLYLSTFNLASDDVIAIGRNFIAQCPIYSYNENTETNRCVIGYTNGANNNLVVGSGNYNVGTSGYNTYLEGYSVYLRSNGGNCYSNGSVISTSDSRLKTDIKPIDDIDKFFMELNPVEYRWKEKDKVKHYGMIAQDVEKTAEKYGMDLSDISLVDEWEDPDGEEKYKALAYTEFIPLCIYMIQKQQKEIEVLKNER